MEVGTLKVEGHFDLDLTLTCGQVFGWKRVGDRWFGLIDGNPVLIRQRGNQIRYRSTSEMEQRNVEYYLGLDDDMKSILDSIDKDPLISKAISGFKGIRILRQDPWECLVSFICATNTNMNSIRRMISNVSMKLGSTCTLAGERIWALPEPDKIANSSEGVLRNCGLGFRARHLRSSAQAVLSDPNLLERIRALDYYSAWRALISRNKEGKLLSGVGPKIADCILLFSLRKMEAFPIDVWMKRIILAHYSTLLDDDILEPLRKGERTSKSLTLGRYGRISKVMRDYFGRYSGYAQEYLYAYARASGAKALTPVKGS